MAEAEPGGSFVVDADFTAVADALQRLEGLSKSFGSQLTGALKSAVVHGRDLEDVLRGIGLNLAGMALNKGLEPLQGLAGEAFSGILGALGSILPFAKGGVPGRVTPFADGGIVSRPSYFPIARDIGLMGEAGAEAILPLRRGADGSLGVATQGGGATVNVVFNVSSPDAASFRRSEAQITGMLARAVSRGTRTL
jgi:phage-related minor tail protein